LIKVALIVVFVIAAAFAASRTDVFQQFRERHETNRVCCDFSAWQALSVTWDEVVNGRVYPSEIGQDKWVAVNVFPTERSGYFLDVGSGHGTIGSNTKMLEERGWSGVCVDPFPTHMEGRTCQVFKEVVSSEPGQRVKFHTHAGLGGIADTLGKWKAEASKSPAVELTTTTLGDILERAKAPPFIHFMSIDIEGAELEALRGIPFEKYRFGAMAIEHNEEEPKRTDILEFLEARGYRRTHSFRQDDFYRAR
jgi:FkbM family methyltransferase